MKVSVIKINGRYDHNTVKMRKHRQYMSMICWKPFYLVVRGIIIIIKAKNKKNITLTCSSIFHMCGDVPKVHCGIFIRSQWYGQYKMCLCK